MNRYKMRRVHIAVIVCVVLILVFAIFQCQRVIKEELQVQVQENLEDVATQNLVTLENEIEDKHNLLRSMSKELSQHAVDNKEEVLKVLSPLTEIYNFKRIGFVYPDGKAYTTDGYQKDLSAREFFKKSMIGQEYVTGSIEDTIGTDRGKINVFSAPVYDKSGVNIEGVVFATYETSKFAELLDLDLFGGEGYHYVILSDGTVVASSPRSTLRVKDNILDYVEERNGENKNAAIQLRKGMESSSLGHVSFILDNENYAYYAPMRYYSFDNRTSYVLTLVPAKVMQERVSPVLRYVNILLVAIVVVLGVTVFWYLYYYRNSRNTLWNMAYQDSLTKDDNYACFELKMTEKKDISGFLISMDLSEFKIVNSTCGIEKGDEALSRVWLVLRRTVRVTELAARINADQFVMFLEEDKKDVVITRLQQITDMIIKLSEDLNIPKLSPYFGIYRIKDEESLEVAYSCANEAKHLVKGHHNKNYAFYDEVDFQQIKENKELEDRFEEAIAHREFEVWYQPKYSTDNGVIVGAEALTRWRNPDGSLIPPFKFIPLFEKNGMIAILDEYVFRTVCEQQKSWESDGKDLLPISINISRASLYYSNIVEKYKKILAEYDIEAKYVPLEITESATIDNMEIRELIDEFHAVGFPLLLDDFGNGYSSLATLNVMHFDVLKLDKSLVDHIGDENGEKLLYYTVKLAKSLGMKITAEGVEYHEQVLFLQKLECNDIQGYYFSKPLPLEEYQKQMWS